MASISMASVKTGTIKIYDGTRSSQVCFYASTTMSFLLAIEDPPGYDHRTSSKDYERRACTRAEVGRWRACIIYLYTGNENRGKDVSTAASSGATEKAIVFTNANADCDKIEAIETTTETITYNL